MNGLRWIFLALLLLWPLGVMAEEGIWQSQPGDEVETVQLTAPQPPGASWSLSQMQEAARSALAQGVEALQQNPHQPWAWGLLLLALGYGVLHAAGPGHGKAVVVSLMIADEGAGWRKGLGLGFAVAMLENLSALGLVYGMYFLATARLWEGFSQVQGWLQPLAYSCIMALGAWLAVKRWRKFKALRQAPLPHHHHAPGQACIHEKVWKADAWPTALSFALIPCPGTVILLMFLLSFQLLVLGVWMTLSMALGMALTISAFALAAAVSKDRLLAWASRGRGEAARFKALVELVGALAVVASAGLLWLLFGSQGFG